MNDLSAVIDKSAERLRADAVELNNQPVPDMPSLEQRIKDTPLQDAAEVMVPDDLTSDLAIFMAQAQMCAKYEAEGNTRDYVYAAIRLAQLVVGTMDTKTAEIWGNSQ